MNAATRKTLRKALENARRAVLREGVTIGADTAAHVEFWRNVSLWSAGALAGAQERHEKYKAASVKAWAATRPACDCSPVVVNGERIHNVTCAMFDGLPLLKSTRGQQ